MRRDLRRCVRRGLPRCCSSAARGATTVFNHAGSDAALASLWTGTKSHPGALPVWMAAAAVGALVGGHIGSRRLDAVRLQQVLAIVLVIAGVTLALGL